MNINYTSKLYYKKYPFKVVLKYDPVPLKTPNRTTWNNWNRPEDHPTFKLIEAWCEKNAPNSYKIIRSWRGWRTAHYWHVAIFLEQQSQKDQCVLDWASDLHTVFQPLDNDHAQKLGFKTLHEVRKDLIYKKYSHVMYMKYQGTRTLFDELQKFSVCSDQTDLKGSEWWPKVYSSSLEDIQQLQLMYGEHVTYVKHVTLIP